MTDASHVTLDDRPTVPSTALAVVLSSLPVVLLVGERVSVPLAVVWVGLFVIATGSTVVRKGRRVGGTVLTISGLVVGIAGGLFGGVTAGTGAQTLQVVPGLLGVVLVGTTLTWPRFRWRRGLLKAGAVLAFAVVLVDGLSPEAAVGPLLWSALAVVLAWDIAENGISVGEHLGRDASTWRAELAHAGGGGAFGVMSVGVALVAADIQAISLSLPALVLVLLGVVFLIAALHD